MINGSLGMWCLRFDLNVMLNLYTIIIRDTAIWWSQILATENCYVWSWVACKSIRHFRISHNTLCWRVSCTSTHANSFAQELSSCSLGTFNRPCECLHVLGSNKHTNKVYYGRCGNGEFLSFNMALRSVWSARMSKTLFFKFACRIWHVCSSSKWSIFSTRNFSTQQWF